jgi:acetoin utilization protein AcuB
MTEQPTVGEFMTEHVHVISMESTLPAARKLMAEHQIRHLPVMDGRHVVGLLSERDLSKLEGFPMLRMSAVTVPDAMSTLPYVVEPDTPLVDVLKNLLEQRLGSAVVTNESGKVVGIFTASDAIKLLIDKVA